MPGGPASPADKAGIVRTFAFGCVLFAVAISADIAISAWSPRDNILFALVGVLAAIVGLLLRRHRLTDERLAAERGWVVADRYVDDDISAWSGRERPEYARLFADLEARAIGGVVVWHLDRLHQEGHAEEPDDERRDHRLLADARTGGIVVAEHVGIRAAHTGKQ